MASLDRASAWDYLAASTEVMDRWRDRNLSFTVAPPRRLLKAAASSRRRGRDVTTSD
jgi:hypothetical protein